MTWRTPEPPLDPPDNKLTADDVEMLIEEAKALRDKISGAAWIIPGDKTGYLLFEAEEKVQVAIYNLESARQHLEGE